MYRMTDEEFETAIAEALDAMPEQFMEALNNVAIVWEEEPSAYHVGYDEEWDIDQRLSKTKMAPNRIRLRNAMQKTTQQRKTQAANTRRRTTRTNSTTFSGCSTGLSIVERANGYDDDIPDVITIFKGPHERCFNSREEIVEEVGKTIIHELGHYFGLNEDQLARHGLRVRGQDSPAPSHATP